MPIPDGLQTLTRARSTSASGIDFRLADRLGYIAIVAALIFVRHRFRARAPGSVFIGRAAGITFWLNLAVAAVASTAWLSGPPASTAVIRHPGYIIVAAISFTYPLWLAASFAVSRAPRRPGVRRLRVDSGVQLQGFASSSAGYMSGSVVDHC